MSETAAYLHATELTLGGPRVSGIPRRHVSPYDPRSAEELRQTRMTSGGRMELYAQVYADELFAGASSPTWWGLRDAARARLGSPEPLVLIELGILRGSGLALWSHIFRHDRVVGLDVDLTHYALSRSDLRARGAFMCNEPDVHLFDELADDAAEVLDQDVCMGHKISVVIDDALHDDESVMRAMEVFVPRLAPGALYFVEDNDTVHLRITERFPALKVRSYGRITVCEN